MMYFWLVPALLLLVLLFWGLYSAATKRAPGRTSGRTLVDKPSAEKPPVS